MLCRIGSHTAVFTVLSGTKSDHDSGTEAHIQHGVRYELVVKMQKHTHDLHVVYYRFVVYVHPPHFTCHQSTELTASEAARISALEKRLKVLPIEPNTKNIIVWNCVSGLRKETK